MLSTVLEAKEKQLAKKSKRRLRWFSAKPLYSFISVTPELSEDAPLWGRVEMDWTNVRLLGLKPEQLQEELQRYWAKPSWRQWFQRLFTSINQQLEIWFYYQQCLALREIKQSEPEINFDLSVAIPLTASQCVMEKLSGWLIEDELKFENYLSRCSARWLTKHFEATLGDYTEQRSKKFYQKLEKELKASKTKDMTKITEEIQAAYQQTEKIMLAYLLTWYRNTYPTTPHQSRDSVEETRMVVADPLAIASPGQIVSPAYGVVANQEEKRGLSSRDPELWTNDKQAQLRGILEKKPDDVTQQVTHLLEYSLSTFIGFIEPQLQCYQDTIDNALKVQDGYQKAQEVTKSMQSNILSAYRQGLLLFHQDHYHALLKDLSSEMTCNWNGIFTRYKQSSDNSLAKLSNGQAQLMKHVKQFSTNNLALDNIQQDLDQLEADRQAFRQEFNDKFKAQQEEIKRLRELMNCFGLFQAANVPEDSAQPSAPDVEDSASCQP